MSLTARAGWYARRLRAMGPEEFAWRTGKALRVALASGAAAQPADDTELIGAPADWDALLAAFRAARDRPALLTRARARAIGSACPDEMDALLGAAERARQHRFAHLGYPDHALGLEIDWHRDGPTGGHWPSRPSDRIDYRAAGADPKWIWELNRLQHLPWLAQAWLVTDDQAWAEEALDQLEGWIAQNPEGIGIAWRGGFECGVRAISVAVALQGLRDAPCLTPTRYRAAVACLWRLARRAWRERSRGSSANNHLVGELTGAAVVGLSLPELAGADDLARRALAALTREAIRQVRADGSGAEQSLAYQVFTGDLLLVAATLTVAAGRPAPTAVVSALQRGAGYVAGILGDDDPLLRDGDDDDGFAIRLGPEERRDPRGHLGAVAALTGDSAARRSGTLDLTARWLTGEAGERRFAATAHGPAPRSFVAPVGGTVVLRRDGVRATMDAGPLGYLTIAAHGHADALSVTLAANGRELVSDPGPGSYFAQPELRRALRGTAAHATVAVDGEDQSVSGGPFLWTRHAKARLLHADLEARYAVAEHDGYTRLPDPVEHRRHLLLLPGGDALVLDLLRTAGDHRISSAWPLHPDLAVERAAAEQRSAREGAPALVVAQVASVPAEPYAVCGECEPPRGWWSERLEARRPAPVVGLTMEGRGTIAIATLLIVARGPAWPAPGLRLGLEGDRARLEWREADRRQAVEIDTALPEHPPVVLELDAAAREPVGQ